jgi:hypothetical protein
MAGVTCGLLGSVLTCKGSPGARIAQSIQAIAALWWNSIRTTETITQLLDFVYVDRQWDKSVIKSIQVDWNLFLDPALAGPYVSRSL